MLLGEHLLLHACSLLRCHCLHLGVWHGGVAGLASLRLHVLAVASPVVHVVAGAAAVVVWLATTLTVVLPAVLVGSLTLVTLALLAVSTAHLAAITHGAAILAAWSSHVVKILHEVLLYLVEAALLALLVQFLGGHPELD